MKFTRKDKLLKPFVLIVIGLLLIAVTWVERTQSVAQSDGSIALQRPLFVKVASASEENAFSSFADDEAGIAAYFDAGSSINLNDVDQLFRTIESQTSSYIIGSLPLTDYDEDHDPHVYISTDGWVMAYYREDTPTGKIFDWRHYDGSANLSTKLDIALDSVAAEIGAISNPAYYHFNYPNATDMMLIADWFPRGEYSDSFDVNIPAGFSYFERSWSLGKDSRYSTRRSNYYLDGNEIGETNTLSNWDYQEGTLSASQLAPDAAHTISIRTTYEDVGGFGGLALVYRVP